ncbi:MAG: DUF3179 domain-containing (seleno)protein [Chloroflexi bacterium]|nr:DUF3179 domain-containing (seleno)protein [Chloroflexota bacterium]
MNVFWITLSPRLRILTAFLAGTAIALLGFLASGGLEPVDFLFAIYVGGLLVYFLVRWGYFAERITIVLPNQEHASYEKLRKNPGRRRHGPSTEAEFIDADEADEELLPDDRIIGIFFNGEAAAYPLAALAVRETSNEEFGDTPLIISWSPVTYSARAFLSTAGTNQALLLGRHSHTLFNSPVLPDTNGNGVVQFTGQAVVGDLVGWTLEKVPVITTTWAAWKLAHPDTEVMSTQGGPESDAFERYYANDRNGIHSLNPEDKRLSGKDVVLGLDVNGEAKAYSYPGMIERPLVEETLGETPVLIVHERASATSAAYTRVVNGQTLSFKGKSRNPRRHSVESTSSGEGERSEYEPWLLEDIQTNSTWRAITGECTDGKLKGSRLEMIPGMTGFWFAWSRFYPNALLFGANEDVTAETESHSATEHQD